MLANYKIYTEQNIKEKYRIIVIATVNIPIKFQNTAWNL